MLKGRETIYTMVLPEEMQWEGYFGDTLNDKTLIDEIERVFNIHMKNSREHRKLLDIYKGNHDVLSRPQKDRIVNNRIPVNYPQTATRDIVGYVYNGGVQFVPIKTENSESVQKLSSYFQKENFSEIVMRFAVNQSIGGRAFIGITSNKQGISDAPFEIREFDPEYTEVVYSAYNNRIPVYAFTRYAFMENKTERWMFQVWTSTRTYIFSAGVSSKGLGGRRFIGETINPLGKIPIIEIPNNQFRIGDWETSIELMNAIDNLVSDSINDVEQFVMSYLVLFGVEVEQEDWDKMKHERLLVLPGAQGITQDAKFITAQLDGTSAQQLREFLVETLKFIIGLPDRDVGESGSDTGEASRVRTGSTDMEYVAQLKLPFTVGAVKKLLEIALKLLSPICEDIHTEDIDIEIPRKKLENLLTKTQSGLNMYRMNMPIEHITRFMDLTSDTAGLSQAWRKNNEETISDLGVNKNDDVV